MDQPPPITARYTESIDYFIESVEQTGAETKSIWIGLIAGLLIVGALTIKDFNRRHDYWDLLPVPLVIALAWFFMLGKGARRRSVKSSLKAHLSDPPATTEWNIGEDGLFVGTSKGVNSHYPWQAVIFVVRRPSGLLVYISKHLFFWLPDASFASPESTSRVLEIANQKGRTIINDSDPKGFLQKAEYFPKN